MILIPEQALTKANEAAPNAVADVPLGDPPPRYTSQPPSTAVSPAGTQTDPIVKVKPTNYVSLARSNGSVKGTFSINPSLYIPSSLLPPLLEGETEETRANLRLSSKNGTVDADISIVSNGSEPAKGRHRVTMNVKTCNGSITTKLHAPSVRLPFQLTAYSSNGNIHLRIPRSFRGPIIFTTHNGCFSSSEAVSANLTIFSEVNKTRRGFVGDFSEWTEGEDGWRGDEIIAETKNGSVKVHYDDEVIESLESIIKAKVGMISRMFRF